MIRSAGGTPLPNADNTYLSTITWPKVAAHRMATHGYGENVIQGGLAQLYAGIKVLDTDLWLTQDGVAVLMHDLAVDRTTNGTGNVDALTAAHIASLRVDTGTRKPQKVPLLTDLTIFKGRAIVTIEHKPGPDASAVPALAASLAGMEDSIIIQTFWGTARDAWKAAGFTVMPMGATAGQAAGYYASGYRWLGFAFTGTGTPQEKALISEAKAAGMKVATYTHTTQAHVNAAITAGSDMPIMDYPTGK